HMPPAFWKQFADRIRAKRPGFFMFGEAFDYQAENIAPFTWASNGGVSVLDFPLKQRMAEVFGRGRGDFALLSDRLYLTDGPYANPYDLMTFYD
ncbi:cyclomaltodextrin glucanotransferase, partial [Lysobacter sp. 2RAB21]